MKRFFALLLAASMLSTFAVPVSAASKNPVTGISSKGYLADEDNSSRVDLGSSVNLVPYGKTVYFPLLSDGSGQLSSLKTAMDAAKKALDDKTTEIKNVLTPDFTSKETAYNAAVKKQGEAEKALSDAGTGNVKKELENKMNAIGVELATEKAKLEKLKDVPQTEIDNLTKAVTDAQTVVNNVGGYIEQIRVLQEKYDGIPVTDSGDKATALQALNAKKDEWDNSKRDNGWTGKSDSEIKTIVQGNLDTAKNALQIKKQEKEAYTSAVASVAKKQQEFEAAEKAWKEAPADPDLGKLKQALEDAKAEVTRTKGPYDTAKSAKETAEKLVSPTGSLTVAYNKAKTDYDNAKGKLFPYVHETSAAGDASVKVSWESGSSTYANSPEIVKKRASNMGSYTGGSDYIYFIAVPIKSRSTNDTHDIFGKITAKQTKGEKWEHSFSLAIEVGYERAETDSDEATITKDKQTFRRSDFESGTEITFYFDADSDSKFVFNNRNAMPDKITLSFDIEPDSKMDKISDKIYKEYGANVDFYNGYSSPSFNSTGTLYLAPSDGEDDYYVYSIASNGDVAKVSAKWDSSEDAYAINTRTLGRYFLSSKRLTDSFIKTLNGGSSSGSGSSSSSGSGSGNSSSSGSGGLIVVPPPVTSSQPASSYTPPTTPSKPASSTPPASSSSQSSSEQESSIDEEISDPPEDEDASSEDIIDVDTETDDTETPEKGGSTLVWVLAIVGLLAAGGAVAFVVYSNKIKRNDDGYSEYDEYDDDNDFPDDDDR